MKRNDEGGVVLTSESCLHALVRDRFMTSFESSAMSCNHLSYIFGQKYNQCLDKCQNLLSEQTFDAFEVRNSKTRSTD